MMMSDSALLAWLPASPSEVPVLVAAVQSVARQRGLDSIPPPPDAPDNCCGNDCIECVWLGYYPLLGDWRDAVVASWAGR